MTKIKVDLETINQYEQQLVKHTEKFIEIQKYLAGVVETTHGMWGGVDGNNFYANASTFANNLSAVTKKLVDSVTAVSDRKKDYIGRIEKYWG